MTRKQRVRQNNLWLILAVGAGLFYLMTGQRLPLAVSEQAASEGETVAVVASEASESAAGSNWEQAVVARIVDGDTIVLTDGRKVRYIGIDTPETKHPTKPEGCYGREATAKNTELVAGKMVELEKDVSETDRYGRLLRYVYVDGQMVNELLVAQGFATASTYPPDVKYQEKLAAAQKQAQAEKLGLWGEACLSE